MELLQHVLSTKNIPNEIVLKVYMYCIPRISLHLKDELINLCDCFYSYKIRKLYITKHERIKIKYRIKQKLNYYSKIT